MRHAQLKALFVKPRPQKRGFVFIEAFFHQYRILSMAHPLSLLGG
jgi:hypothetical protein